MAKTVAVTEAVKNLAETEAKFGLHQSQDEQFFAEWATHLPSLTDTGQVELDVMRHRLTYHRSIGDLLEGAVTLLVASPLLEIAGFYDPPFRMQSETAVELVIDDGEEILRGRIDLLVMQNQFGHAKPVLGAGCGIEKDQHFGAIGIASSTSGSLGTVEAILRSLNNP